MMWDNGYGWGGWVVMGAMMVIFWALLIVAGMVVVHLLRPVDHGRRSEPADERGFRRAEALLAERLARGEIDEDDYRKRLSVLREDRP